MTSVDELWTMRRRPDGLVAGVCGALADRWRVDPLVVRIVTVLLALSAGIGVVLYLFAWLLWPMAEESQSPVQRYAPRLAEQSREFWTVAVAVSTIGVAVTVGSVAPIGALPALVVVAVWYFGFRRPQQQAQRDAVPLTPGTPVRDPFVGAPTPFTEAAREWQQTVLRHRQRVQASASAPMDVTPATGATPSDPTDPDPRAGTTPATVGQPASTLSYRLDDYRLDDDPPADLRRAEALSAPTAAVRSYLEVPDPVGLYRGRPEPAAPTRRPASRRGPRALLVGWLLVTALAVGGVAVADRLTGWPITLATYVGTALAVASLGLVLAGFVGRFRGQLALALALLVATVAVAVPDTMARSTDWRQPEKVYTSLADLPPADSIDVGTLDIDLSGLDVTTDTDYRVSAEAGQITLLLPPDTSVQVDSRVEFGQVLIDGDPVHQGPWTDSEPPHRAVFGTGEGPTLRIDARVDAGSIELVTS